MEGRISSQETNFSFSLTHYFWTGNFKKILGTFNFRNCFVFFKYFGASAISFQGRKLYRYCNTKLFLRRAGGCPLIMRRSPSGIQWPWWAARQAMSACKLSLSELVRPFKRSPSPHSIKHVFKTVNCYQLSYFSIKREDYPIKIPDLLDGKVFHF